MKTLAVILNYNQPKITDRLYECLEPFCGNIYDLMVMDNGSLPEMQSKYTSLSLDKNCYWGGGLNFAFQYTLDHPEYDSLLFLNNDVELNGEIFVKTLRNSLFENHLAIATPCIAGSNTPWKQMQNWGCREMRAVKWIDNQAPLFHRKIIEAITQFDERLNYGWGQELVCHDVCEQKKWEIGVCDFISILHTGQQSFRHKNEIKGKNQNHFEDYNHFIKRAKTAMQKYFEVNTGYYSDLYKYGETYSKKDIKIIGNQTPSISKS